MANVRRRPTSADVARLARTSRATVSHVLNDKPGQSISSATRARVLQAAQKLGYTPNSLARDLAMGHSRVVVIAMPPFPSTFKLGQYYQQLSTAITSCGLTPLLWYENEELTASLLSAITPALIIAPYGLDTDDIETFDSLSIPHVEGGHSQELAGLEVGRAQVHYLFSRGSHTIALATTDNPLMQIFSAPRAQGARAALNEAGYRSPFELVLPIPQGGDSAELTQMVNDYLDLNPEIDAFACYNDVHAMPIMNAVLSRGMSIPDDIAIIGVDDELFDSYLPIPLTTFTLAGDPTAAQLLTDGLNMLGITADIEIPKPPIARLVERQSA